MATKSPFSLPGDLFERLAQFAPEPPQWLVQETQQRLVLLLNHVVMQEPAAMQRLARRKGRMVRVQWRQFFLALQVTPAGLWDLAVPGTTPDLHFEVTEGSPLGLAQAALRGERPPVRIDGDVDFAADLQWLADHLRWDIEDDLSRLIGDVPAHTIASVARKAAQALRSFVRKGPGSADAVAPWSGNGPLP